MDTDTIGLIEVASAAQYLYDHRRTTIPDDRPRIEAARLAAAKGYAALAAHLEVTEREAMRVVRADRQAKIFEREEALLAARRP